jgi:undecaprenyl-diphosphatase
VPAGPVWSVDTVAAMSPPDPSPNPTRRRRAVFGVPAAALLALGALGFLLDRLGDAERVDEPSDLDVFIHAWVVHNRPEWPWVTGLFHAATQFGNPNIATFATALVTFGLYALSRTGLGRVRRAEALVWLGAILGGRLLSLVLKEVYHRERPPVVHRLVVETSYSFPSGHSVFAAVFFAMLAVVLARLLPARWFCVRAATVIACLALAVLVGASRIWLGVHYPTDVLGGLLLGFGWVFAVTMLRRGWARRHGGAAQGRGAIPETR